MTPALPQQPSTPDELQERLAGSEECAPDVYPNSPAIPMRCGR